MRTFRFAKGIFGRIKQKGLVKALLFAGARFQLVRSAGNAFLASSQSTPIGGSKQAYRVAAKHSIFDGIQPDTVIAAIEKNSWFPNFNLPSKLVNKITSATRNSLLSSPLQPGFKFHQKDTRIAERRLAQPVVFAEYSDLAESNRTLAVICNDPILRLIAAKYLGREPNKVAPRLVVSFAAEASPAQRLEQGQTTLFHYDVNGFREIHFNFYLTDTDEYSGAHVVVEGTHGRKRLRHLIGVTNVTDDDITKFYPEGKITTICGHRGYGFVEDPYCFHKALAPRDHDRLYLQISCR